MARPERPKQITTAYAVSPGASAASGAPTASGAPATPGELLRAARLRRRISLVDAEQATHIRQSYLQALEDDEYGALPPGVYSRGFLRNYAIFLGVPPEQVMTGLRERRTRERRTMLRSTSRPLRSSPSSLVWILVAAGGLAAAVVFGLAWLGLTAPSDATPPAGGAPPASATSLVTLPPLAPAATPTAAPAAAPTVAPTVAPSPTPPGGRQQVDVELRATERSWVRATVDGQIVFEETLAPGQAQRWTGRQSVTLRVGNAGGVDVTANGQRIGALGPAGQPADREFTR